MAKPRQSQRDPESPEKSETEATTNGAPASSTGSSGASDFFTDPGPEFSDDTAGEHDEAAELPPADAPPGEVLPPAMWERDTVKRLLIAQGSALHALAGKSERDWVYTQDELTAIAPPLTNILNRYPVTAAAAGTADELALVVGLTGYVTRSWQERRQAIAAAETEEPETPFVAVPDPGEPPSEAPGDDELPPEPPPAAQTVM